MINQTGKGANISPSAGCANRILAMAENEDRDRRGGHSSRAASTETLGLIVVAVILALILLLRWGGDITWSAR